MTTNMISNARIDDLLKGFVGRAWVFDEISQFLRQDHDHYLVITGEAGIGKSAIAARLTRLLDLQAVHFCRASDGGTLEPVAFVRSISSQLSACLDGFGEAIVRQASAAVNVSIKQEIKEQKGGNVYGVYIENFPIQSADEAFQILVRDPLDAWSQENKDGRKIIILVDALDEGMRLDRHPNIVDLIVRARDVSQIQWILTSRPAGQLQSIPGARLVMLDNSQANLDDARAYVQERLAEESTRQALEKQGRDLPAFRDEIVRRSGGNFLYLRYVLDGIARELAAGRQIGPIESLPLGLGGVYQEFLDRIFARKARDEWQRVFRPVLGCMVAAQEILDFDQLAAFSQVSVQDLQDVLLEVGEFLDIPTKERQRQLPLLPHLVCRFPFGSREQSRLLDRCQQFPSEDCRRSTWVSIARRMIGISANPYGLRNLPAHLDRGNLHDRLVTLLSNYTWLECQAGSDQSACVTRGF